MSGPGLMPSGSGTLRRLAWCHNLTSIRPVMPASISTDRANGWAQTSHSGISRARFLARNRSCSLSGTGHTGCLGCFNPWGEKLTEAISVNRKHSELLGECERVKKRSVGTISTYFLYTRTVWNKYNFDTTRHWQIGEGFTLNQFSLRNC